MENDRRHVVQCRSVFQLPVALFDQAAEPPVRRLVQVERLRKTIALAGTHGCSGCRSAAAAKRSPRAYHGCEEARAQPAPSRHEPIAERPRQAAVRCNGLLGRKCRARLEAMRSFTAVIERDPATGLFVGYVPGWPGAHSQGATMDELRQNLEEVVTMLLQDGEPKFEGEFVGTQTVKVA